MCARILMAVASERKGLGASQVCCGSALLFCTFSTSLFSPRVGRSSMAVVATVVHPPWSDRFRSPPLRLQLEEGSLVSLKFLTQKKIFFPCFFLRGANKARGAPGVVRWVAGVRTFS